MPQHLTSAFSTLTAEQLDPGPQNLAKLDKGWDASQDINIKWIEGAFMGAVIIYGRGGGGKGGET